MIKVWRQKDNPNNYIETHIDQEKIINVKECRNGLTEILLEDKISLIVRESVDEVNDLIHYANEEKKAYDNVILKIKDSIHNK